MDHVQFKKSSYSGGNPEACVEVGFGTSGVLVRDSTDPELATVPFNRSAWACFVASPSITKSTSA
ncbi:hypothetical protein UK23_11335 [Lentzea aerocolonigenes]|uniref:DUF397 domain-containing protein n=2 Tax=Lentzea TaxID=165301 RepID=A0A0F0H424_LENAE|nr:MULTISPECIES: DUF397 domain-containing protein [Lentzea]KJK50260.1 hypothetical protein UK23_11335 [Lentzea aerocolonigenes]SDL17203.1 protein of unknown function [Lentzea albidocapillata subsp. violacea]